MYRAWSAATDLMLKSRAGTCPGVEFEIGRGGFMQFQRSRIARWGDLGQSFQGPMLCNWSHVAQKLIEYQIALRRRGHVRAHAIAQHIAGLAPPFEHFMPGGAPREASWWRTQLAALPSDDGPTPAALCDSASGLDSRPL
eukprot:7345944-Pyramimonas_sp.AAC.1